MKIIHNNTNTNILIADTGVTILANANYTIPSQDYTLWAASSDIITQVGNGNLIVNDGTNTLSKAESISLLQSNFKQTDFASGLKSNDGRLKVEILSTVVSASDVALTPSGSISSTNVQAAINELDNEKTTDIDSIINALIFG